MGLSKIYNLYKASKTISGVKQLRLDNHALD